MWKGFLPSVHFQVDHVTQSNVPRDQEAKSIIMYNPIKKFLSKIMVRGCSGQILEFGHRTFVIFFPVGTGGTLDILFLYDMLVFLIALRKQSRFFC